MQNISTLQRLMLPITLVVMLVALVFAYMQSHNEITSVENNAKALAKVQLRLLALTESIVGNQVQASMNMLKHEAQKIGTPNIAGYTLLKNQRIPNLQFGNTTMTENNSLVDHVTNIVGGTATLFVKSDDQFIRVSTNIKQGRGGRALGTQLDPTGKAIKTIQQGKAFYGVVDILGNPYITGYEPMYNSTGEVIGVWYVGFAANIQALREIVQETRFLKSGFSAMLDEHQDIRFLSSHAAPDFAKKILTQRPDNWTFITEKMPSWGFSVIFAYPNNEARLLGLAKAIYVLFLAALVLILFSAILISQIKRLVIKPIGGDPARAVELVKRIATGDLAEDGMQAKPNTLMSDMLKMRGNLRKMIETLHQNSQNLSLAASVFEHTRDGIFITDANINIVQVNRSFEKMTGYSKQEAIGKNPRMLHFAKFNSGSMASLINQIRNKGEWCGEIKNKRKTGEKYIAWLDISTVLDETGKVSHYLGVFSDITLMKQQQESLENMAYHDNLTKLPNRALFFDRLNQAIAQAKRNQQPFAVCYLDLNGFKPINDMLGHAAGDLLLIKLSQRIRDCLRSCDTVARIGGDEFAVLLSEPKNKEEACITLQRILDTIKAPYLIHNQEVRVSASAGIIINQDYALKPEDILRFADHAMYVAKSSEDVEYYIHPSLA
jgi:diguanylate cyclase (GGDEF)-like protein/PAS domain S-box-containing protein